MHDAECRFQPFGYNQPLARGHMGQSYSAAGNWTKASLIVFDSSFARAIRGNEGSMDGCRSVTYMFDQADHRRQICIARVRATRVESQHGQRRERKVGDSFSAIWAVIIDIRPQVVMFDASVPDGVSTSLTR
jgi:hypothetical protein